MKKWAACWEKNLEGVLNGVVKDYYFKKHSINSRIPFSLFLEAITGETKENIIF